MKKLVAGAIGLFAFATAAHAAAILSFQESGGNVVATLSGSLNMSGLTGSGLYGQQVGMAPSAARVGIGVNMASVTYFADVLSGPAAFGSGGASFPSSSSGDSVFLVGNADDLFMPTGYAGGPLSATMTFAGASFSSLGLTSGDYVYTLRSQDTFTVRIAAASVPEPGTLALLGLGLAGLAASRRRRQ